MALHKIGVFVVLSSVFNIGSSIRCYDCNSVNNSMCLDPTIYDAETVHNYLRSADCSEGLYSPDHKEFFCRKITQTILHKNHDSEVRVTRGCGWIKHKKECYKADNEDHLETVCQCFSDHCNAAGLLPKNTLIGSLIPSAAVLGLSQIFHSKW